MNTPRPPARAAGKPTPRQPLRPIPPRPGPSRPGPGRAVPSRPSPSGPSVAGRRPSPFAHEKPAPHEPAARSRRAKEPPPTAISDDDRAARKADHVADDLLRKITSRELGVGALLPKEAELSEAYGVNRSVVREAVKLLEVHRLVRPVRRLGTVVLEPLHSMSPEVLMAMLCPKPLHVDRKVLASFLELRALLDVEMTGLAAERRLASDVAALRTHVGNLAKVAGDVGRFRAEQATFAMALARATHNPLFEMLAGWNARVVRELEANAITARPPSRQQAQGFSLLVDLIDRREAKAARTLVRSFHEWLSPRVLASAALASGAPLHDLTREA